MTLQEQLAAAEQKGFDRGYRLGKSAGEREEWARQFDRRLKDIDKGPAELGAKLDAELAR